MSKEINNSEYRKNAIKEMLKQLHEGKTVDEVKGYFNEVFKNVSATEISQAEQALIAEGLPVGEIQKLCDVHAAVFEGSVAEIHSVPESEKPGHPVWVIKKENAELEKVVKNLLLPALEQAKTDFATGKQAVLDALDKLKDVKAHYLRKENIIFPYLEKHGITGPPMVMWAVDDEIRQNINIAYDLTVGEKEFSDYITAAVKKAADGVTEMIFKEENILIPMLLETLSAEEWVKIDKETPELGYTLISNPPKWTPPKSVAAASAAPSAPQKAQDKQGDSKADINEGVVSFDTGKLSVKELSAILNVLPLDITFVGKDDKVKYFSDDAERIFPRTKAVLGREVVNCHPPGSMHVVEKILQDFENGVKDEESFWINMRGQFIYIRYFAVRDKDGQYLGTLEATQNITGIKELTGEKRLLSD